MIFWSSNKFCETLLVLVYSLINNRKKKQSLHQKFLNNTVFVHGRKGKTNKKLKSRVFFARLSHSFIFGIHTTMKEKIVNFIEFLSLHSNLSYPQKEASEWERKKHIIPPFCQQEMDCLMANKKKDFATTIV